MHQTMNWIWPLTGGGACNPIDACHESEEAVLVENEDHEWIIPPIPVSGTLNANTNGMKDRHTHALNMSRGLSAKHTSRRPMPTACRPTPRRSGAREQMRGQAGAGGRKWASSR